MRRCLMDFLYFFNHNFAKIYGQPEILQKYISAVVAHGVRDIMPWPPAVGAARSGCIVWDRHRAVPHDVRGLASWATALCPSTMGHGGPQRQQAY
jgi:hypothetical protein